MPKIWVGRTTLNEEKKENGLKYQKTWQTFQKDVICKDELLFFVSERRKRKRNCETIVSVSQLFMQKAPEKYWMVLLALEHVFQ